MIDESIGKIIDRYNGAGSLYLECKDTSNSFKIIKEDFESYGYEVVHIYSKSNINKIKNKIQGVRDKTIKTMDFLNCSRYRSIKEYNSDNEEKIRPIILAIEDTTKFYDTYWEMSCPANKEDAEISHMLTDILNVGRATGTTILLICNYTSRYREHFEWLKIDTTKRIRYASRDEVLLNRKQEYNKDYIKKNYKYLQECEYARKVDNIQTNIVEKEFSKQGKYRDLKYKLLKTPIRKVMPVLLWSVTLNLVLVLMCILIFNMLYTAAIKEKTVTKLNNNIKITAAHLGDLEGYKLIHEDSDRDVSYYLANDLKLTEVPMQEVIIEGLENCKIVSSSPGVFLVETSTPDKIVNGMSGKRVYDLNNNEIGFVDALVKDKKIKCITLE